MGDYDRGIERDDGRTEYIGIWHGRVLMIGTEGEDEPVLVVNAIDRTMSE